MTTTRRSRRLLSEEERALWRTITRSVAPLGRKRRRGADESPEAPSASGPADAPAAPAASHRALPAARVAPAKPPPLTTIDRRTRQRLTRGSETIDARLDLHGRTQSQAHASLMRFLHKAQADGARTVLVITGKGTVAADSERGVLRRQVPLWLELPEFRRLVLGYGDAGIGHGGAGALYVRLRRGR